MALAYRGTGAFVGSGSATTGATASATPNAPATVATGDRAFIGAVSTGPITTPSGWTALLASTQLGGGTIANTTGARYTSVFYRSYDGSAMPSLTSSAVAGVAPGIATWSWAFSKAAGEQFDLPTIGTGSDTTSGTGTSITTPSFADPSGSILTLFFAWPISPGTLSALSVTASGATFAANTSRVGVNGNTTGNDVFLAAWTFPVTTGATATHTAAVTGTVAHTAGAVLISQKVSATLDKLRAGSGTVLLNVGASPATKAYIGATQVWP